MNYDLCVQQCEVQSMSMLAQYMPNIQTFIDDNSELEPSDSQSHLKNQPIDHKHDRASKTSAKQTK